MSELLNSVLAREFGAMELLAIGLGAGMAIALLIRRPSRESVLYFAGMACVMAATLLLLRQGFSVFYGQHLEVVTHQTVGAIFNLVGYKVDVGPHHIATENYAIRLVSGCSGISFISVFAVVILIYPARARAKAIGLGVGLAAVAVINLLRFGILLWIGEHHREYIPTAKDIHAFVFVVCLMLLWWGWLAWVNRMGYSTAMNEPTPRDPSSADTSCVVDA